MKQAIIQIGGYLAFSREALQIRDELITEIAVKQTIETLDKDRQKNEILTVKQVANQEGVKPVTVIRWIDSKKLKGSRIGTGNYKVTRYDLNEFLRQSKK